MAILLQQTDVVYHIVQILMVSFTTLVWLKNYNAEVCVNLELKYDVEIKLEKI